MGTDLFRITMSSTVDRNRYIAALLSTSGPISKSGIPECLRPGGLASKHHEPDKKADAGVPPVEPRHPRN